MQLYRRHSGEQLTKVTNQPDGLDVTASRKGNRIFLHVVNTKRTQSVTCRIAIEGKQIVSGRIFELHSDAEFELNESNAEALTIKEIPFPIDKDWSVPAASVSAVELDLA